MANIDIEMHTHNDFGMATANALGGIKAGANWVGVTMNGLGSEPEMLLWKKWSWP